MNKYPVFRKVEAAPIEHEGQQLIHIHDPFGFSNPLAVSPGAFFLMTLMDGNNGLTEIREAFHKATGQLAAKDEIQEIITALDEAFYLDNGRFRAHRAAVIRKFAESPTRKPALAGKSYPADREGLLKLIDGLLAKASPGAGGVKAIIVPHIDFRVGGDMMAAGWSHARNSGADLFIILGIGHSLTEDFVSCLAKDFETPAGPMRVDKGFLENLRRNFGEDIYSQPEAHMNEHSIEFQSLFFARLFGDNPEAAAAPILLSFPENVWDYGHEKFNGDRVDRFINALKKTVEESGRQALYVASVDFSHVGRRFGDMGKLDDAQLARIGVDDREIMALFNDGDRAGFLEKLRGVNGNNRVCGFPALYTLLAALENTRGETLEYRQNMEGDRETLVSFASMVARG
ncbi:MAG: AmmeMemoRadiSam system protein B [Nitrospinae bacterium]|nr:AmmeMemoRadiSam system protein B [Nitrospinota bacterium]